MLGDAALAHDAAQEAFIAAYVNLGALREAAAFPGWFRRVVIKHSDRERRSRKTNQPLAEAVEFRRHTPTLSVRWKHRRRKARFTQLSPSYHRCRDK